MPRKGYDKKQLNHNMTGEHANGRRNPNPRPPQSAKEVRKKYATDGKEVA